MATEQLYADAHIAGTFSNPTNAVGSTTGTWAGDLNTNANYTSRWSVANPVGVLASGATHTVSVLARKGTNSGTPTIAINVWRNGTLVSSGAAQNVTSTTGETLTRTFTTAEVVNGSELEVELVETGAGGSGAVRNSAQVDTIAVTMETAPAPVPVDTARSTTWNVEPAPIRVERALSTTWNVAGPEVADPYGQQVVSLAPVGYWRMDQTTGDYLDYSGNARSAAVTDTDASLVRNAAGGPASTDTGLALQRTAGTDTVQAPLPVDASNIGTIGNVLTLEAWVNLTDPAPAAHQYVLFLDHGGSDRIGLVPRRNSTGNRLSVWDNLGLWKESTATLTYGVWHHIVAVVNGTSTTFYLNGALLNTVTVGTAPAGTYSRANISATQLGAEWTHGLTDEVALYGYALTAEQVRANYDAATKVTVDTARSTTWNVEAGATTTPVDTSRSSTWNVAAEPSTAYALTTEAGTTLTTEAGATLTTEEGAAAPTTQVDASRGSSWGVAELATRPASTSWTVGGWVDAGRGSSWDVLEPVDTARGAAWDTAGQVDAARGTSWDVSARVDTSAGSSWDVGGRVEVSAGTSWTVAAPVDMAAGTSWAVRTAVDTDRPASWSTAGQVQASTGTSWQVEQTAPTSSVSRAIGTTWDVRAPVDTSAAGAWDVLEPVNRAAGGSWAVRAAVDLSRTASWDTLAGADTDRATTWQADQQVQASTATTWAVQGAPGSVSRQVGTTWDVAGTVELGRAASWDVRTRVDQARPASWAVLLRLAEARASSWLVDAPVAVTRTTSWAVQANAPAALPVRGPTTILLEQTGLHGITVEDTGLHGITLHPELGGL